MYLNHLCAGPLSLPFIDFPLPFQCLSTLFVRSEPANPTHKVASRVLRVRTESVGLFRSPQKLPAAEAEAEAEAAAAPSGDSVLETACVEIAKLEQRVAAQDVQLTELQELIDEMVAEHAEVRPQGKAFLSKIAPFFSKTLPFFAVCRRWPTIAERRRKCTSCRSWCDTAFP